MAEIMNKRLNRLLAIFVTPLDQKDRCCKSMVHIMVITKLGLVAPIRIVFLFSLLLEETFLSFYYDAM